MKKIILSMATVGLFIATLPSCNNAPAVDPAATQKQVDDLAAAKIETLNAKATAECETRMATELKGMTDSMVHAKQMEAAAQ